MDPKSSLLTRRSFLARSAYTGVGLAGLGALAAACSSSSVTAAPTAAGTTAATAAGTAAAGTAAATVWPTVDFYTWGTYDKALWDAAVAKFGGPNINTEHFLASTYQQKLTAAFSSGQAPDLIATRAGVGFFQPYVDSNSLLALNDVVPGLANFPQTALDALSVKGKVYAVPSNIQVVQVWMNQSVAPTLGKDGPATWAEFMDLGKQLKAKGIGLMAMAGADSWSLPFELAAIAATDLSNDFITQLIAGTAKFTDDPWVNVFKKFQELSTYAQPGAAAASWTDQETAVGTGKAAGMISGSWIPSDYTVTLKLPVPDMQFLVPPETAGGQRAASFYYDGGWAVNANSPRKDAAIALANIAAKPEFGQLIADMQSNVPAIAGKYPPTVSKDVHLARSIELTKYQTPQVWWQYSVFDAGNPGISSLMSPACQGLLTGQLTPQKAAQSVQDGLKTWYPFK